MSSLLRYYRTLRRAGVGRIASARAAWRVEHGRLPDEGQWPEPEDEREGMPHG